MYGIHTEEQVEDLIDVIISAICLKTTHTPLPTPTSAGGLGFSEKRDLRE